MSTNSSNSGSMLKSLEANLAEVMPAEELASNEKTLADNRAGKEIQDDYEFSRETYRDLVNKSNEALEVMLELARSSEHPRAFEVLSTMLKNTSDIADKLMDLQKKKKEVKGEAAKTAPTGGVTQNNMFVGSTAELQKMLLQQAKERRD